jgi:predicted transcriptional regulator
MSNSATGVENLRSSRIALGVSQSKLARLSGVSRFKICSYELGDGAMSPDQQSRIREALQAEAERLRSISIHIEFGQPQPVAGTGGR